jgi:hypothetical protein
VKVHWSEEKLKPNFGLCRSLLEPVRKLNQTRPAKTEKISENFNFFVFCEIKKNQFSL